jgi:hypothetical protein
VIADGRGRAIAFALAPGQAHELPLAPGLLGCLPDVPGWVVGDRGLASGAFRERIWDLARISHHQPRAAPLVPQFASPFSILPIQVGSTGAHATTTPCLPRHGRGLPVSC